MMQMLSRGGVELVTDGERSADEDNPRGYLEFEPVKKLKSNSTWLPAARGKAVKVISQLLFNLPASENYDLIWMERDLDEILASQEKMLQRLGRPSPPSAALKQAFVQHLDQVHTWLQAGANFRTHRVQYANLVATPASESERIAQFLELPLDLAAMCAAVDPALYRNRGDSSATDSDP